MASNTWGSETLFVGTWPLTSDHYASVTYGDSRLITATGC